MTPGFAEVEAAAERIGDRAHRTPVVTSRTLDRRAGRRLFFKCENLQRVGAFKIRGATNFLVKRRGAIGAGGVVTHSSGNHAQAVALAARTEGLPAAIVMPENASAVKRRAVEGYGGRVVPCRPGLAAREAALARVLEETGGTYLPPYNDPDVIAGQGTATLELLRQAGNLDTVVAPVGGGGLISGACLAAHGVDPAIRVIAAEPAGADDAARSLAAGRLIPQTDPRTLADGLLTSLGEHTWAIIREHVERVITVSEEEIVTAMRLVWERVKLVIEPSAAVAVAAVLGDEMRALGGLDRVGVILSGGNVDLDRLPWVHAGTSSA